MDGSLNKAISKTNEHVAIQKYSMPMLLLVEVHATSTSMQYYFKLIWLFMKRN